MKIEEFGRSYIPDNWKLIYTHKNLSMKHWRSRPCKSFIILQSKYRGVHIVGANSLTISQCRTSLHVLWYELLLYGLLCIIHKLCVLALGTHACLLDFFWVPAKSAILCAGFPQNFENFASSHRS